MFLEKPAFSVSLLLSEAEKKVSSLLKKKHWAKFTFSSAVHAAGSTHGHGSLYYVPYWFFSYDVYEDTPAKTVFITNASNALNAFTNEFEDHAVSILEKEFAEKGNEIADDPNVHVIESRISESEAREIILVSIASEHHTTRKNVILSGLELVYVPIWLLEVKLENEERISVRVNAVSGVVINKDAIPTREKGFAELTNELLKELSTPQGWLDYSSAVISDFSKNTEPKKFSVHAGASAHSGSKKDGSIPGFKMDEDKLVLLLAFLAIIIVLSSAFVR